MKEDFFDGYEPFFELGFFEDKSPAVRVISENEICPIQTASLVVAMFETIMRTVPEEHQISFENAFNKALKILMEERFDYDVVIKYPADE